MRYSIQHDNITTTASRGQGGSRFEPQPKGYGMSQNRHFECPQATFDSMLSIRWTDTSYVVYGSSSPVFSVGCWFTFTCAGYDYDETAL